MYLMVSGIKTRKPRMIKWSAVESPQVAGQKVGRFFYPILKKSQKISIAGQGSFSSEFFEGFKASAEKISPTTKVFSNDLGKSGADLLIQVIELNTERCTQDCPTGQETNCECKLALWRFNKKTRDRSKQWIHIVRTEESKAALFIVHPETHI